MKLHPKNLTDYCTNLQGLTALNQILYDMSYKLQLDISVSTSSKISLVISSNSDSLV